MWSPAFHFRKSLAAYLANKIFTSNFRHSRQKTFPTTKSFWFAFFLVWVKNGFFYLHKKVSNFAKKFVKFTIKHLWWSRFSIKMLAACNCIETKAPAQVFSCSVFFINNTLSWLSPIFLSAVMWSVLFIFQIRKRDSKKSSAHVLCAAIFNSTRNFFKN